MMVTWSTIVRRKIDWKSLERDQRELIQSVRETPSNAFFLVSEPAPTFTAGLSAKDEDLLWSDKQLANAGVIKTSVKRGGKWTFHGPGQIVVYPIVKINQLGYGARSVHLFLETLARTIVEYLDHIEVKTYLNEQPFGIFHDGKKLVSFGIGIERGVVSNGLALYYKDQSRYFQGINPCGVPDGKVTCLEQLGVKLSWDEVALGLIERLKNSFNLSER